MTVKAAEACGCEVVHVENLSIGTFGQGASGFELRSVVRVDLKPLYGGEIASVEAYVVPEISVIKNQHLEVARKNYGHLKDLWLSDVCKSSEDLEVDVLAGQIICGYYREIVLDVVRRASQLQLILFSVEWFVDLLVALMWTNPLLLWQTSCLPKCEILQ